jgi:hypothetical protein
MIDINKRSLRLVSSVFDSKKVLDGWSPALFTSTSVLETIYHFEFRILTDVNICAYLMFIFQIPVRT